ncbi:MAG: hypothetical protein NWE96_04055 [Candidatus Bathyarchaeota archaeon]|nr:hypothetical protein [Candidatus Bathyarchaeota archaeon]
MRRGGWRTNRKTGGHFYSYGYGSYNKQYLPRIGKNVLRELSVQPRNYRQMLQQKENLKISTVINALGQVPLINEIHAAYVAADFLWTNWALISNLYSIYDKKGPDGLAKVIGTDIVKDCLTDAQTDIFWSQISRIVPAPLQPEVKACFSRVVEKITDVEVDFVRNFLAEQTRKK